MRNDNTLILCGDHEVFAVTLDDPIREVWRWRADAASGIPEAIRPRFGTTDDCKPVDGGETILVTSSGGAAALVSRKTGRATFWCCVWNAHSAERLPGNRLVVAGSTSPDGNRLALFDRNQSEAERFTTPLFGAHGVVWDATAKRLWALGQRELQAYRLADWEGSAPRLDPIQTWTLPDEHGHDLRLLEAQRQLLLTTRESVWTFDIRTSAFAHFEPLANIRDVKSVDIHPVTGQIVWTQAETNWWTHHVYFKHPEQTLNFPNEPRLYKVRFNALGLKLP
jgi:hypothetical protein